jgi:hypothetical protein
MFHHMDQAITHNGECHRDSNRIHLARENLTTQRMHCPEDLTYNYLSLSPSNVEFAPLHMG